MFSRRSNWDLRVNEFSRLTARLAEEGRPLLDLTVSNPTACGFDFPATLLAPLAEPDGLKYDPLPQGLLSARQAVSDYYAQEHGVAVPPENIFLGTGTSELYSYLFRLLCDPDDEVLIARPSYPLFEFLGTIQDVRLRDFPLFYDHGWHMDLKALENAITLRTRAIVLVHPNNPTGNFVNSQERAQLNRIAREHDLALIVDEVFLDYSFTEQKPQTFAGNDAFTCTLSGLSKVCGLPQMKVAWCVFSGEEGLRKEAMDRAEVIADTYLSLSTPVQSAVPALLASRFDFQAQLKQRLAANLAELVRQMGAQSLVSRLEVQGGWYAVLRVPATQSDEQFVLWLAEDHGVLAHPGHFFDFEKDGHIVVSLMTPEADFRAGIKLLLQAVAERER